MSGLSVKRSLFQTPTRSSKRARGAKTPRRNSQVMRVPAYLKPETKQYRKPGLTNGGPLTCYSSIPTDMAQGDSAGEFIGAKFRLTRLRVYYDLSHISFSRGIRISVLIPKKAGTTPPGFTIDSWDTNLFTVLYDMLLPNDPSVLSGTFDVTGPINIELDGAGVNILRNDILIVFTSSNGATVQSNVSYTVWYTDA